MFSGFNGLPQFVHTILPKGTNEPHFGHMFLKYCFDDRLMVSGHHLSKEAPHPEQNFAPSFTSLPQLLQNGIFHSYISYCNFSPQFGQNLFSSDNSAPQLSHLITSSSTSTVSSDIGSAGSSSVAVKSFPHPGQNLESLNNP